MAFSKITKDMNIIAALDDEPNDVGGLSAAQLKAKFDEGGLALKTFINNWIDAIAAGTAAANIGAKNANDEAVTLQSLLDDLEDAAAGTVPDGSITTAKLHNGAVTAEKLDDPAPALVGTIIQSVRTDLGDKWALCNGEDYDPTEYADLAAVLPKNEFPKANPNLTAGVTSYGACFGLHNGEFATLVNLNQKIRIVAADGSPKHLCETSSSWTTQSLKAIEHNGTKYVVFVVGGSTTISVYTTSDFSSYTLAKTITTTNAMSYGDPISANFDGTYYYLLFDNANSSPTGHYAVVIDSSFNLVHERTISYADAKITMCGDAAYCVIGYSSKVYVAKLNGDVPTSLTDYRSVTATFGSAGYLHITPFNDDYDFLYNGYTKVIFIPTDGTSALKTYTLTGDADVAYLNGDGTELLVYIDVSGTYYCARCSASAADPTQSSAWTSAPVGYSNAGTVLGDTDISRNGWRYGTGVLPGSTYLARAPLLPTIASNEYYNYIKVKE
jgi:hypothetical protein